MYKKEINRLEANIIELQDLAYLLNKKDIYNKSIKLVGELEDSVSRGSLTLFVNLLETCTSSVKCICKTFPDFLLIGKNGL